MAVFGSRSIALASGVLALVASLAFALAVTRRLPAGDLALLSVVNNGLAIAAALAGFATVWYPRVLAREPEKYGELLTVGLLVGGVGAAAGLCYVVLFSPWVSPSPLALVLYIAIALVGALPAGAYLSVHRQRLAAGLNLASQLTKAGGALVVRSTPTAESALAISLLTSLPTALAVRARPKFRLEAVLQLARGAPFQALVLLTTAAWSAVVYAIAAAGGDTALYYNMLLFQMSKAIYPALAIVPLMYGSMLTTGVERRALIDGAIYTAVLLAAGGVMLNAPQAIMALLRPQELDNAELHTAIRINAISLVSWGLALHAWTTLMAEEKKTIITPRDKPAKSLYLELAAYPAFIPAYYYAVLHYGVVGLAAAGATQALYTLAIRVKYLEIRRKLLAQLYLPTAVALAATALLPPLPHASQIQILDALINAAIHTAYYATPAYIAIIILSPPYREIIKITIRRKR